MASFLQPQLVADACTWVTSRCLWAEDSDWNCSNYLHKPWPQEALVWNTQVLWHYYFLIKHYCNFLVLARAHRGRLFHLQFHQLPAPGQYKMYLIFPLLPDELVWPLCARKVPLSLRLETPFIISDSVLVWVWYSNAYWKLFIILLTLWHD